MSSPCPLVDYSILHFKYFNKFQKLLRHGSFTKQSEILQCSQTAMIFTYDSLGVENIRSISPAHESKFEPCGASHSTELQRVEQLAHSLLVSKGQQKSNEQRLHTSTTVSTFHTIRCYILLPHFTLKTVTDRRRRKKVFEIHKMYQANPERRRTTTCCSVGPNTYYTSRIGGKPARYNPFATLGLLSTIIRTTFVI